MLDSTSRLHPRCAALLWHSDTRRCVLQSASGLMTWGCIGGAGGGSTLEFVPFTKRGWLSKPSMFKAMRVARSTVAMAKNENMMPKHVVASFTQAAQHAHTHPTGAFLSSSSSSESFRRDALMSNWRESKRPLLDFRRRDDAMCPRKRDPSYSGSGTPLTLSKKSTYIWERSKLCARQSVEERVLQGRSRGHAR